MYLSFTPNFGQGDTHHDLRIFQHTPETYKQDADTTVYEGNSYAWVWSWGDAGSRRFRIILEEPTGGAVFSLGLEGKT